MATTPRGRVPTRAELAAWRGYLETSEVVRSRVEARLHADSGLSTGDYRVLLELSEADGNRLRSSELATGIEWERSH